MRIDEQLAIVIPVDREDGSVVHVYATPISREVFQTYWLVLSKTFASMYEEGLALASGPRIAAMMLRHKAEEMRLWDGPAGVQLGLMREIRRLANVMVPPDWQIYPMDDALARNLITEDDADEIDGVLVFFTLVWRLHLRKDRRVILDGAVSMWGASTSSLRLSAFIASLPTSTETDSTGATPPAPSSPPSSTGLPVLATRPASGNGSMTSPGARP
jgi:hypothetical protein